MREVEGLARGEAPSLCWAGGWFTLSTPPSVRESRGQPLRLRSAMLPWVEARVEFWSQVAGVRIPVPLLTS